MNQPPNLTSNFDHWKKRSAWFLSSQTVSLFGSSITQYAIVWHITLSTTSGTMIMLSTLCSFLPQILISMFAGVWADRHNRKHLIMAADGMIACATLLMAIVFMTGYQELWVLFLVSAIRSVGAGIQTPAVSALIPQIVPQDQLMRINGLNATIQSLTMLISPAVSGVVLGQFGLEAAFFIDVITAALAILILWRLKVPKLIRSQSNAQVSAMKDLKFGLSFVWHHRFLRTFLSFYSVLMFLVTPAAFLSPLLIARSFGEEVWRLTANEMIWSLGMVIGGVMISIWGGFKNRMHTLILGIAIFGVFTMLLGFSTNFILFLILLFVTGLSMPLINSAGMVLLQESVAQDMQGRIFGLVQIVASASMPLGMAIFGPLADYVKIEWLLIFTGGLMAVLGLAALKNKNLKNGITLQASQTTDAEQGEAE